MAVRDEVSIAGIGPRTRLAARLRGIVCFLLKEQGLSASIEVVLLGSRELSRIKRRFFGHRKVKPDVISFREPSGFPHPESRKRSLGEIYVNREIVEEDFGRFVKLVIHGFLHLAGYEHSGERGILKMEQEEERLWDHVSSSGWMSGRRRLR